MVIFLLSWTKDIKFAFWKQVLTVIKFDKFILTHYKHPSFKIIKKIKEIMPLKIQLR